MNGGIDSQIQGAMMSAGNNPQALQQRYQQTRSLVDLLALQKLKSEKEAAARDIQMKMQQQPQTIVEQREQELMGATRQELMQKMAPTIQRTGQESAQRAAQQGQTGIASQAPPQMGMKEGGLVPGYAEGGMTLTNNPATDTLIGKNLDEALALLKKGMPLEAVMKLFPNLDKRMLEAATDIKEAGAKAGTIGSTAAGVAAIPKIGGGLMEDLYERAKVLPEGMAENVLKPAIAGFTGNYAVDGEASKPNQEQPDQLKPIHPQRGKLLTPSGIAGLGNNLGSSGGSSGSGSGSGSGSTYDPALTDMETETNEYLRRTMNAKPGEEADAARTRVEGILAPLLAKHKEGEAITLQQRMLGEEQTSPERQRRKQLIASLLGGANKRGFGSVMSGVGRAGMAQADANEAAKRDVLATHKASDQTDFSNLSGIMDSIASADNTAYEGTKTRAGQAANTASIASANQRNAALRADTNRIAAELNAITKGNMDTVKKMDLYRKVSSDIQDAEAEMQQLIEYDPAYSKEIAGLKEDIAKNIANGDLDKANNKKVKLAQILAEARASYPQSQAIQQLKEMARKVGTELGYPDISGKSDDGFSATRID